MSKQINFRPKSYNADVISKVMSKYQINQSEALNYIISVYYLRLSNFPKESESQEKNV